MTSILRQIVTIIIRHTSATAAESTQVQSGLHSAGWLTAAAASFCDGRALTEELGILGGRYHA